MTKKEIYRLKIWADDIDRGLGIDVENDDNLYLEYNEGYYDSDNDTASIKIDKLYKILHGTEIVNSIKYLKNEKKELNSELTTLRKDKSKLLKEIRSLTNVLDIANEHEKTMRGLAEK